MCTFDQVDTLYTFIEQKFFTNDNWTEVNVSLSGHQQKESVVNAMVEDKFKGFNKYKRIYIGAKKYSVKALPKQNKYTRNEHRYQHVEAAESFVNIMVYRYNPDTKKNDTMLNIHIVLQTLASERKQARRVNRTIEDEDGFRPA